MMNISILGSGNVATVLAKLVYSKEINVVQVIARNQFEAKQLAEQVEAEAIDINDKIIEVDVLIIALSDNAIEKAIQNLQLNNSVVVHTAGSISLNILQNCSPNFGVFYPLQSLNKNSSQIPDIPFLIEANNEAAEKIILNLANTLSDKVEKADEQTRIQLHTAAVFVNNFTNYLYTLAEQYCHIEQLDFDLLKPIITETAIRIKSTAPATLQTGPAKRNDTKTIEKHFKILEQHLEMKDVYDFFTKKIQEKYK